VCFPQFAEEGPILKHGFARLSTWELVHNGHLDSSAQAIFQLEDSAATRKIWPHAFRARLTVTVGGQGLRLELEIQNSGTTPFTFTGALHTYLNVDDISAAVVEDLAGTCFRDSVTGLPGNRQVDAEVRFAGEVDRIYLDAPNQLTVREPQRRLTALANGFPDLVLWNPGPEKCVALKDMPEDGYRRMLCVEAAVIAEPPELAPGATWRGTQAFRA